MNIKLYKVRIENYRSIEKLELELHESTVLFGMNDSGKSNFLKALKLAIDGGSIDERDVHSSPSAPYSNKKQVIIDLMFIPINTDGRRIDEFEGLWREHLGVHKMTDGTEEFFSFRTKFSFDEYDNGYSRTRNVLKVWDPNNVGEKLSYTIISKFDLILIDAGRDISLEIRDRSSLWGKEMVNLSIEQGQKLIIEERLSELNKSIVNNSSLLRNALEHFKHITADNECCIELSPVSRDVNDIQRGMEIYVKQKNASSISIANMGLGTRNRASFAFMKAVVDERIKNIEPYYCMIAFEEPESHVHPNSQRKLVEDFIRMDVQRIITTHSPYILSAIDIETLIHVSLNDAISEFHSFNDLNIEKEDIRKIKQMVLGSKGELLFSKIVVLVEGSTESEALPIFIKKYFSKEAYEVGITIIKVDGNNYLPFLRVLSYAGIKWFIFSDGEKKVEKSLKETIKELNNLLELPNIEDE